MKCRPAVGAATDPRVARVDGLVALAVRRQCRRRLIYGGSGTCPIASTSASRSRPRRPESDSSVRRPKKRRSRISPSSAPAGAFEPTRAPGFSFWPGMHQRLEQRRAVRAPLDRRRRAAGTRPRRRSARDGRAGGPRIPACRSRPAGRPRRSSDGRSPILRSLVSPLRRSSASRRDSPRGAASCAINSSGRWKSKSDTSTG